MSADAGLHPSWCALRGQAACGNPGHLEKRETYKAPYLPSSSYSWYSSVKRVQVVVAMMFFFSPPRTVAGVRNARCVAADGRTSGHSLRPPQNLRTVQLLAGAHTLTHSRTRSQTRSQAHTDRMMVTFCAGADGEDGRFKYHTRWRCELTA